jgi:hypothetical protein
LLLSSTTVIIHFYPTLSKNENLLLCFQPRPATRLTPHTDQLLTTNPASMLVPLPSQVGPWGSYYIWPRQC